MPDGAVMLTVHIQRFNPELDELPHTESYRVPALPGDRLLNVLHYIKWYIDGTLTFRRSCAHGVCGSDAMRINGRNRLCCKVLVKDLIGDKRNEVTVEPIKGLPLLKDLIVDMEPFFDAYRAVKPFLITHGNEPTREYVQSPEGPRTVRRHHQVHPLRGVHHVLPGVLVRGRLRRARRPSSTPTGSSSTPATRAARSGWRSSPTPRASGAAAPPSTAPRPARAASRSPRRSRKSSAP